MFLSSNWITVVVTVLVPPEDWIFWKKWGKVCPLALLLGNKTLQTAITVEVADYSGRFLVVLNASHQIKFSHTVLQVFCKRGMEDRVNVKAAIWATSCFLCLVLLCLLDGTEEDSSSLQLYICGLKVKSIQLMVITNQSSAKVVFGLSHWFRHSTLRLRLRRGGAAGLVGLVLFMGTQWG